METEQPNKGAGATPTRLARCRELRAEPTDAKKHPEILISRLLIKKTDKRQGWDPEDQGEIY